jgi:hypothetical protein
MSKRNGEPRHGDCSDAQAVIMDFVGEIDSMEWIRRACDYRTLTGKRDELGFPLGSVEATRLAELEQFFLETLHPARATYWQRDQGRVPISVVVSFGPCGGKKGRARDISGEGLFVETSEPLPVGTRTVVSVLDRATAEEWRFGAEVVRLSSGARRGMGLRLVGIPLALRVGHRSSPVRPVRRAA